MEDGNLTLTAIVTLDFAYITCQHHGIAIIPLTSHGTYCSCVRDLPSLKQLYTIICSMYNNIIIRILQECIVIIIAIKMDSKKHDIRQISHYC